MNQADPTICIQKYKIFSGHAFHVSAALQAPLSMGFSRQEYWSGLPCPPPGDLPNPGIQPKSLTSPALGGRFFTTSTTWEPLVRGDKYINTYVAPALLQGAVRVSWAGSLWQMSIILAGAQPLPSQCGSAGNLKETGWQSVWASLLERNLHLLSKLENNASSRSTGWNTAFFAFENPQGSLLELQKCPCPEAQPGDLMPQAR